MRLKQAFVGVEREREDFVREGAPVGAGGD